MERSMQGRNRSMLSRHRGFVWCGLGRGTHDVEARSSRGVVRARSPSPSSVLVREESDVDYLIDDYDELVKLIETKFVRSERRRGKMLGRHEAQLEAYDADLLESGFWQEEEHLARQPNGSWRQRAIWTSSTFPLVPTTSKLGGAAAAIRAPVRCPGPYLHRLGLISLTGSRVDLVLNKYKLSLFI